MNKNGKTLTTVEVVTGIEVSTSSAIWGMFEGFSNNKGFRKEKINEHYLAGCTKLLRMNQT